MKFIKQFLIIIGISFLGEVLKICLPFPIPASIYGMVILFMGLMTGVVKLKSVNETGKLLIEIMPVMFIPAGVGLMTSWGILSTFWFSITIITIMTSITVMIATGWVAQIIIRKSGKKKNE